MRGRTTENTIASLQVESRKQAKASRATVITGEGVGKEE